MRKYLKFAFIFLISMMMLMLCAHAETVCEHMYEEIVLNPATCTEKGILMQYCSLCGVRSYGAIEPAHTYNAEPDVIVPPSCDEEGGKVWYCTVCNADQDPELDGVDCETIPATHSYGNDVRYIAATCEEDGMFVHTCTVCGEVEVIQIDEEAKALGHDWKYEHHDADCESAEKYQIICLNCDQVRWEMNAVASAPLGHQKPENIEVLKEADCENASLIAWVCDACGIRVEESEGIALGHTIDVIIKEEATCTADGVADHVCSICEKIIAADVVLPADVDCCPYEVVIAPSTCTENGIMEYRCKWCDEHLRFGTIPYGHEAGDVVPVTPAGCAETGIGHVYCMVCEELLKEITLPALGHKYDHAPVLNADDCNGSVRALLVCANCNHEELADAVEREAQHQQAYRYIAPNCEMHGIVEIYCSVCDVILHEIEVVDDTALGHIYPEEMTVIDAPDCENAGSAAWICQRCSALSGETTLEALGHTAELQVVKEATCVSDGICKNICTTCDAVLEENIVLPMVTECEPKQEVLIASSCTTDGLCQYVCKWCDRLMGYEIMLANHIAGEANVVVEPTCMQEGEVKVYCLLCEEMLSNTTLARTEHVYNFENGVQVQEANCTNGALVHYYCEICNADGSNSEVGVSTEYVGEALGHTWAEETDYVAANCVYAGRNVKICLSCGAQEIVSFDRSAPALGHRVIFSLKMPTCTEPMMVVGVCSVCDQVIDCEETQPIEGLHTAALGHTEPEEWQIELAPDCEHAGLRTKRCTVCNEVIESEELPAVACLEKVECILQHPDCGTEANAVSLLTCEWCNSIVRIQVDAYKHTFNTEDAVVLLEAGCETEGILLEKCALCGAEMQSAISPVGHVASEPYVIGADCENADRVIISCLTCGEVLSLEAEMGEPLGHEFKVYDPAVGANVCMYCHAVEVN